jgi:class 3 adenylate cyclase
MPAALRTYLFTNLVGYTELMQSLGDEAGARVIRTYRRMVTAQIGQQPTAKIQELTGDTVYATFRIPEEAIKAALGIVSAAARQERRDSSLPFSVGVGIHAGQAVQQGTGYVGSAVSLASRLSDAAQPKQILISDTVYGLLRTTDIGSVVDLGVWGPERFGQLVHVYEVLGQSSQSSRSPHPGERRRRLQAVLFTDIVLSTQRQAEVGDHAWKHLVEKHHALVRAALRRYQGHEVDTAGDGFFATFDSPTAAIDCALAIVREVKALDLEIRAGIHVGECEIIAGKVGGIAVVVGARAREAARPSQVLATQTVRDVVAGSEYVFSAPRVRSLKGIPGKWRLYTIAERDAPNGPD